MRRQPNVRAALEDLLRRFGVGFEIGHSADADNGADRQVRRRVLDSCVDRVSHLERSKKVLFLPCPSCLTLVDP
jgi:hypothetical protein